MGSGLWIPHGHLADEPGAALFVAAHLGARQLVVEARNMRAAGLVLQPNLPALGPLPRALEQDLSVRQLHAKKSVLDDAS